VLAGCRIVRKDLLEVGVAEICCIQPGASDPETDGGVTWQKELVEMTHA
jgi:hypothetical protein